MTDYAENASFYTLTYKIDKTAPQLTFAGITENTDYTFYGGRVNTSFTVDKNDSSAALSSGDGYSNPSIGSYAGNTATPRTGHLRNNLHAFYFQNNLSGDGANSPFAANLNYSDNYNGFLTQTATMSDGTNTSLVAGEKKFQLLTADSLPTGLGDVPAGPSMAASTANLIDNNVNGQKDYRIRLYDDTFDQNGNSGNYAETAFYAVRDNTPPNMGGNGLAPDVQTAIDTTLKFPDAETVFDKTIGSGFSRFFAANNAASILYSVSDKGITGNGSIAGTGCSDYGLCNAGVDPATMKINIESAATPGTQETFYQPTDRFENIGQKTKDFSRSDNGALASNGGYRYYPAQFLSNNLTELCDTVGNCIAPDLKFRVVANALDGTASHLSIAANNGETKIMANGSDAYRLTYGLRDKYGNKVVPVQSVENASAVIKNVTTNAVFANGLSADQRTNTPTGAKLVSVADKETDNTVFQGSNINTTGNITMQEKFTNPNGNFGISLASKVPSNDFYPYLSDDSTLKVALI